MMRKKRILWICNHVTLMDAEVPLLLELGFEVFVPKKFPKGSEFVSCVSKDIYDPSLTIPPEDLALLNTVDFYDDLFSDEVIDAMRAVGAMMSPLLKETGRGGVAASPTAVRFRTDFFGKTQE